MNKRYNSGMSDTAKFMAELKRLGVSDSRAAEISGLDRSHVWRIVTGHTKSITLDDAATIARELGVSIDQVCGIEATVSNSA